MWRLMSRQTTDNDKFDEIFFTSKVIAGAKARKKQYKDNY